MNVLEQEALHAIKKYCNNNKLYVATAVLQGLLSSKQNVGYQSKEALVEECITLANIMLRKLNN